ncbi:MAG: MaoC family dehydratase N-terminal domain-containing protein [Burkholderiales bacterium]|nr:MaoC family dehydratase N-terminal domain-containing protein [Burkholderiales bacterium]
MPRPRWRRPVSDTYAPWLGRTEHSTDTVSAAPVRALAATLDRDDITARPGDPLPPLWHWLYFLPVAPQRELGEDGHPRRGGFLPPVPLPRRMWAGSRFEFVAPLRVGDAIERTSTILNIEQKTGRSGELVFVCVGHEVCRADGEVLLREEHDIVYRAPSPAGAPKVAPEPKAPPAHAWQRTIAPDAALLFRYSALTFNGHRIHYDRTYATGVEGYPGLVVHGPLQATLMLDLLGRERPGAQLGAFSFQARQPVFDIAPFHVCGDIDASTGEAHLLTYTADGRVALEGSASFA